MSKLADALRAIWVINTWSLLRQFGEKGRDIAVSFHGYKARPYRPAATEVWSPSMRYDPKAIWGYDSKIKTFSGTRSVSLLTAKVWAGKTYGIERWAPCPMIRNSYVPADVVERARKAVGVK